MQIQHFLFSLGDKRGEDEQHGCTAPRLDVDEWNLTTIGVLLPLFRSAPVPGKIGCLLCVRSVVACDGDTGSRTAEFSSRGW
jgi:hypothetical protein